MIYTGVGSRETPESVLVYMRQLAFRLASRGYLLRSGAAEGADAAFEAGCLEAQGKSEIFLPWKGFNQHADTGFYPAEAHFEAAALLHPAWESLGRGPRALHARNVGQVLGLHLNAPASFVVAWTQDQCESEATRTRKTGGTATAIVLADRRGIPVFNLAKPGAKERLTAFVLAELANHGMS